MRKFLVVGIAAFMLAVMSGCLPNGNNGNNGNGPPPPPPPPEQRVMSILWMGDQHWDWAELTGGVSDSVVKPFYRSIGEQWSEEGYGGTHIVGFHEPFRPDWLEGTEVKLISYLKADSTDNDRIRARVREVKNHPNNGGYWLISGHEPDITGNEPSVEAHKKRRIEQYEIIRDEDPDAWNHPVVIFYNMTGAFAHYPGWQNAFPLPEEGVDCDVFLIDCYAGKHDGGLDVEGMEAGAKLVEIGLSRSKGQFIPCIDAGYKLGGAVPPVVEQFDWWDQHFGPLKACAFWSSGIGQAGFVGVYEDERIAEQVREINRRLGLLN